MNARCSPQRIGAADLADLPRRRRDSYRHKALKPRRCQRTIVFGWITAIESKTSGQRR
jgi:hypothetical protein